MKTKHNISKLMKNSKISANREAHGNKHIKKEKISNKN